MQKTNIIGNANKKLEDINTICCIYAFKRIKDDSYVYIGQTFNIDDKSYITSSVVLLNRLKRNGKDWFWNYYKKEILISFKYDKQLLNKLETYYIMKFNTYVKHNPKGYNYNLGGDGNKGYIFTKEQRKHISDKVKLNRKLNPLTQEQKLNYSKAVENQHKNPSKARLEGFIKAGLKNRGRAKIIFSKEEENLIIKYYKEGLKQTEIALKLNKPYKRVNHFVINTIKRG